MWKQFFIFLLCTISCSLRAQKYDKWLELHGSFENTRFNSHEANEVFQERMGHSDGLNVQFFISEKAFLVSGLSLTSILYKTALLPELAKTQDAHAVHSSTYIFMPLMVGFQLKLGERFYFAPRGGLQIGAPLREKTKYFPGDGTKTYDSNYSLLLQHPVLNSNFEGAFEFAFTDSFRMSLMPFVTKRLSSRSSSVVFRSKSTITYGLRGNLKIKL